MNAMAQVVVSLIGMAAAALFVAAAAELIVRHWDNDLHGTRGRRLDRWT